MKIIIAGGSGFLGNALEKFFTEKQNEVIILTRNPKKKNDILWDARNIGEWANELSNADVLINMTGNRLIVGTTKITKRRFWNQESIAQKLCKRRLINAKIHQKCG